MGSTVELKAHTTDRYGRTVAEVFKGSANINQAMVGQGMAFVYRKYLKGCDDYSLGEVETVSSVSQRGIWMRPLL